MHEIYYVNLMNGDRSSLGNEIHSILSYKVESMIHMWQTFIPSTSTHYDMTHRMNIEERISAIVLSLCSMNSYIQYPLIIAA